MKIIVSGIFSFIGLLLIFIINLSKGKGIVGVLVSPIVGAAVIFGVIFGVLLLLSKILNVDSILAEKQDEESNDTSGKSPSVDKTSVGKNVNFTVSDEDSDTVDKMDSVSSAGGDDNDLSDVSTDKPLSFSDLESDSEGTSESDIKNNSNDFDSPSESFNMKKPAYGVPPEEIIKDKLGVAATPEEIAKGIKTILKRQGGLSDDK